MKKTTLFLVLLFVTVFSALAQEEADVEKFNYSNITEFGFNTTSPEGIAFEATTVHGFSINKKHCIGFGVGIGLHSQIPSTIYTPIFFNYRIYFKPTKTFSPHVNVIAGGVLVDDGKGIIASFSSGFRAGKFSLSSGLSFMAICRTYTQEFISGGYITEIKTDKEWIYPFGVTIKVGFSF